VLFDRYWPAWRPVWLLQFFHVRSLLRLLQRQSNRHFILCVCVSLSLSLSLKHTCSSTHTYDLSMSLSQSLSPSFSLNSNAISLAQIHSVSFSVFFSKTHMLLSRTYTLNQCFFYIFLSVSHKRTHSFSLFLTLSHGHTHSPHVLAHQHSLIHSALLVYGLNPYKRHDCFMSPFSTCQQFLKIAKNFGSNLDFFEFLKKVWKGVFTQAIM